MLASHHEVFWDEREHCVLLQYNLVLQYLFSMKFCERRKHSIRYVHPDAAVSPDQQGNTRKENSVYTLLHAPQYENRS